LLKTEITQKVKLVPSLDTHQDAMAHQSSVAIPGQPSGLAKIASLFGNRRSRTSSVMLGLAVTMGITSFPTNCLDALARTDRSAINSISPSTPDLPATATGTTVADPYVAQLRREIAVMKSRPGVLVAQVAPIRPYPQSIANRTEASSLQFSGEPSISIDVPAPRTRTFKFVPAAQAYNPVPGGDEGYIDNAPTTKPGTTTLDFAWPAAGILTSQYGRRWGRMHRGIDIAGPVGTPIYAAADGVAIVAGWSRGGYGNLVEIRHSDGTVTRYAHNSRLSVGVGQIVRKGQQIAEMGSTGNSTGSHLHFEIRPGGGGAVNPIAHLPSLY
jgi:murein DD-endopeptidase MepM/ murein hydrolase activator NlpD